MQQLVKRFKCVEGGLSFYKDSSPLQLPPFLSLDPYAAQQGEGAPSNNYFLKGVVYHVGSTPSSGHYTADVVRSNQWVSFDDAITGPTTLDSILASPSKKCSAYLLLYSIL